MADSRTERSRGRSPPDRPDWAVATVAHRRTNGSEIATCAVTGDDVDVGEPHFYVTLRQGAPGRWCEYEYDHLVVADGALGELDEWLEGEE